MRFFQKLQLLKSKNSQLTLDILRFFFDPYYLNHSKIALLKSNNGTIVALATVEKSHSENSLSVDLMPYLNEAPKGVMDV